MSFPWRQSPSRSNGPRRSFRRLAALEILESRELLSFDPTPMEQAYMESLNRTRLDPQGELDVYFSSLDPLIARDSNVHGAIQYFGVSSSLLLSQWSELSPAPPLAWNEILMQTATEHNQLMRQKDEQAHELPGELSLGDRIREAGYDFRKVTENIYAFAEGHIHGHAGFMIDWGEGPGGIQSPPGHRINILDPEVIEVGIDVLSESNPFTSVGPYLVTQDFGQPRTLGNPYIVGVVWNDRNFNGIYDPGEGVKDVTIVATTPLGFTYETKSMTAGGYQIQVPPGTYQVNALGGGLANPVAVPNVVITTTNVKVDFRPNQGLRPPVAVTDTATMPLADFVVIDVLANDFDPDGGLDPTTVKITSTPAHGTVQVDAVTGAVTYRAGATRANDVFFYAVHDMSGVMSNPARVNVIVNATVSPPVANNDLYITEQGKTVSIPVLANDLDDDQGGLMVQWTSQPMHGQVIGQGNDLQYQPNGEFFGLETLTYQVRDATNAISGQATVRIYVTQEGLPWRNPVQAMDVDGNGVVSPLDALLVINYLGLDLASDSLPPALSEGPLPFLDVVGDNLITPIDALLVINNLSSVPQAPSSFADSMVQQPAESNVVSEFATERSSVDRRMEDRPPEQLWEVAIVDPRSANRARELPSLATRHREPSSVATAYRRIHEPREAPYAICDAALAEIFAS